MGILSGSKSSSTTNVDSSTTSNQVTAQDSGIGIGAGAVANISGVDPRIQEINAQMMGAVLETSSDGIKTMAGFGRDVLQSMGESATNIYSKSEANSAQAWGHTLDVAGDLLTKTMATGQANSDAARALATQAISAANPQQDSNATMVKIAIAVAVAIAAAIIFKSKG